ncbi:membrane-associated progesterone receptor component 2-like [Melanaphis sacchari]|uniref:membrane-associated progesterone receptor component 2-like n=1 Tax=Melanaphis sacchari TaxID=742174 RepID=UPI000DC12EBF|nr:membrane-associated progesterone receptor component 2-like [Melanaphis sacchari]
MSTNVGNGVPDGVDELLYDVYSVSFWLKVLLNGSLVAIITFLLMKIFMKRNEPQVEEEEDVVLPKMKKRDFTIQELREFDGTKGDGRILVAINGKVFDVTKGKHFYGPGGVYSTFGGHDASRGLATFSVSGKDEYDDLSDLNSLEIESMLEWETQFMEKYDYVGRLLKPGESHSYYTDEEETPTNKLHLENPKQCEPEKPKNYAVGDSTNINELPKTETKDNNEEIIDSIIDPSSDSNDEKAEATKLLDIPTKQDETHTLEK